MTAILGRNIAFRRDVGLRDVVPMPISVMMPGGRTVEVIAANTPVRLAAELGASRIIILPTGYACALPEPPRTVIGKALHAITLMIAWQLMHELEVIPREIEVHLVPTLCPLAISPLDFSASRQLIERAAESSRKWIESGGLTQSASPQELAPHRH